MLTVDRGGVVRKYMRKGMRWMRRQAVRAYDAAVVGALKRTRRERPRFDGGRAYQQLVRQCEFGPRNPGSEGHQRCLEYMTTVLARTCDRVRRQRFTYADRKVEGRVYEGTNVFASFNPFIYRNRILLCAHWDTRPYADEEDDPVDEPILGANDGASGVAVLLEMARVMNECPPAVGVDLVFFDLEDLGDHDYHAHPESLNPFCIGSERFVRRYAWYRPRFGLLLDMVGSTSLTLKKEGYSVAHASEVVDRVWQAAECVSATAFCEEVAEPLWDDHVPFLKRGIPVIDLIDVAYPHWHTLRDTPERCSPEALQQVGNVLVEVVYNG